MQVEEFVQHSSGWTISSIDAVYIELSRYQPLPASSYLQLPPELLNKKAIINVKNSDDKCFL